MVLCVLFVAPGALNVSNFTFVSPTVVNITIEEVSECTYIHSTSVPLSIMRVFLYVHMQLQVDSGETCTPPPPLPVLRYHLTALRFQWYNITIRRGDGDSNQTKQVEANDFTP